MTYGRVAYIPRKFYSDSQRLISHANQICAEYAAQGLKLTLRQVFYQFVARDLFANSQKNYDKLGSVLNDARLAGELSWDYIEDRTRFLRVRPSWDSPQAILSAVSQQYRRDLWETQPAYVEVWIEKDALIGVIENVCNLNRLGYMSCRGYFSASEMREAGLRFSQALNAGKDAYILHFGDHDPSGMDMSRDIQNRLDTYTLYHADATINVKRIALNFDQITQYAPPPNPVKFTDSRSGPYVDRYGEQSWELDALTPGTINALIQAEVDALKDTNAWGYASAQETVEQSQLDRISDRYDDIVAWLDDND